ncbi:MAG: hypothetical protein ACRD3W_30435, partial [Terriglobales bacterium]
KHPVYYQRYDRAFSARGFRPTSILEVGVHSGESTKVFSSVFPDAKIVGIDIKRKKIDFSDYPMVTYLQADQGDATALHAILEEYFPTGVDLVIDDASHIGSLSRATWDAVFPHVRSGGLYIVEDWGTGYWDDFPDGGRFQEYSATLSNGRPPRRLPSHDFGMIGFVKSLVDYTSEAEIRDTQASSATRNSRVAVLEFSQSIVIADKK